MSASPNQALLVFGNSGSLAQSVEQFAFNELVDGSNPSRPTICLFLNQRKVLVYSHPVLYLLDLQGIC